MARNGRTKPPTFTQRSLGEDYYHTIKTDGSVVVWMGTLAGGNSSFQVLFVPAAPIIEAALRTGDCFGNQRHHRRTVRGKLS
jgi:hypothetical protein